MRTVFVGAVEGSARALDGLCAAGHAPVLVMTLPLDRAANHSDFADLRPIAARHGIPVHETARSNAPDTLAALRAAAPDLALVIGWSQLCGAEFRAIPALGCIGFHPSALPRMRGRGVIPWQILCGETQGGATLLWLDEGTDSGDIAAQALFPIDAGRDTARSLYDRAVGAMVPLVIDLMGRLERGERPRTVQDHDLATLCAKREPQDGMIDWTAPAAQIERLIRAVSPPYPAAFTFDDTGRRCIRAARLSAREGYHIGLPGQVQAVGHAVTVLCGDGRCLDLLDYDGPMPKIHARFRSGPCP
ncbi:methionyl-tRNA formyltransferase [Paracoccus benzoatiresistens]|uniref:Formyltransferase family protein n=1 Tax=Paracoccus benzoatiresistens TaxID=2997341 RepID=A0ABT4J0I2_9RHOB|nr:formyltransferase family protein [Paracoccus sp. EF6]MCZ0960625.1 formyltransferase family protein [Paracoccus sp. EF6]